MRIYATLDELRAQMGEVIGSSDWIAVEQPRIRQFACATGGYQWIHQDVDRADSGPYSGATAQGFLTLALLPCMMASAYAIDDVATSINYGLNRVRFAVPVCAGSRVRGHFRLKSIKPAPGGSQIELEVKVELKGATKLACIAETIVLLITRPSSRPNLQASSAATDRPN